MPAKIYFLLTISAPLVAAINAPDPSSEKVALLVAKRVEKKGIALRVRWAFFVPLNVAK